MHSNKETVSFWGPSTMNYLVKLEGTADKQANCIVNTTAALALEMYQVHIMALHQGLKAYFEHAVFFVAVVVDFS